jgi:hypothetical protein
MGGEELIVRNETFSAFGMKKNDGTPNNPKAGGDGK